MELIYEIDDSEYPSLINNLNMSNELSAELRSLMGSTLYEYRNAPIEQKVIDRLFFDLKKTLKEEKLKFKRRELKNSLKHLSEDQHLNVMKELSELDKELLNYNKL